MKKMLFLALPVLAAIAAQAQNKVEKSEHIDMPYTSGYDKVLLLKNGKTAYLHYSGDGGIDVSIYKADRKLACSNNVTSKNWDADQMKNTAVDGAYEINGEIVLFIQQQEKKQPYLYRLRINEDDGKLLKEDEIASTKHSNFAFGLDNARSHMHVIKDPASDYYAAVYYDNVSEDVNDAIRIMYFNGAHILLGSTHIENTDKNVKHTIYMDAAVAGDQGVFVATYFTGSDENEQRKINITKLAAGDKSYTKELDFTDGFKESHMQLAYNKSADRVQMLISTYVNSKRFSNKHYFSSFLCFMNPGSMELSGLKELDNGGVNSYAQSRLPKQKEFTGTAIGMNVSDSRKETAIFSQSLAFTTVQSKYGTYNYTTLTDIGITKIGNDGNFGDAYLAPYAHSVRKFVDKMYMREVGRGTWRDDRHMRRIKTSTQNDVFRYVSTPNASYLIYDDYAKRVNKGFDAKIKRKDQKTFRRNTAVLTMKNGTATETYLLGKPEKKKQSKYCFMQAADQDEEGHFATVMVTKKGHKKKAQLVWVTFD